MTLKLYVDSNPALPDDDELMLITDYVGRNMTKAEVEAFEERLAEDEAFFDRVSPLLDAWYAPGLTPTEIVTLQEMRDEGFFDRKPQRPRYAIYGTLVAAAAAVLAFLIVPHVGEKRGDSSVRTVPQPVVTTPQVAAVPAQHPAPIVNGEPAKSVEVHALPAPVQIAQAEEPGSLPPLARSEGQKIPRVARDETRVPAAPRIRVAAAPEDPHHIAITITNTTPTKTEPGFWGRIRGKIGAVFGRPSDGLPDGRSPRTRRNY